MKTLTNLSATLQEAAWIEQQGVAQTVLDMKNPRFPRHITLGGAGLIISRGPTITIGIPLTELLKLAEQYEPGLVPPTLPTPPVKTPAPTAPAAGA